MENKILENSRDVPENGPDYPWSGLSDSSENADPQTGKLLERSKNCWSKVWLMQSLGYNSEVQHSEGVCQHGQEAARTCVSAAFLFSGSKCRRNPCQQGGTTPEHAAKPQICPNLLRFVRWGHIVSVVFCTLRMGIYSSSCAEELLCSAQPQLPGSWEHQAKGSVHFPEFQDISLLVHWNVCACACAELEKAHEQTMLFVSQSSRAQQHHGTEAPHYSPAPPGCSHQAKMPQGLAMNGVKYITEAKELEGLTTALLFVQHWWWLQDTLNLLQCSLGWALHFPDN